MKANDAKEWVEWLKTFKIEHLIILALIIVIGYLLMHPDKVLIWKGIIQSLFTFSKTAQKSSITNRVCGSIRHATKQMSESERSLFPDTVKIEWKDGENETKESFLKGNQVIIRMNRTDNIDKTTSIAAIEMAKHGVIPNGKRYMEPHLVQASDYLSARKLVASVNKGRSLPYFDESYFRPLYDKDDEFKKYFNQLYTADRNGMYVAVFLNELRKMAELLFPEPSNMDAQKELIDFLQYLNNLCTRSSDMNWRFTGKYIKVDVAFAGDNYVLIRQGYDFYAKKCHEALELASETVYLFSIGMKRNDAVGIESCFHQKYPDYASSTRSQYIHVFDDHRKKEGMCIEFVKKVSSMPIQN